jgi:hypothetical protein
MRGAIRPLPQYAIMAWCLVKKKHKENYFYLRIEWALVNTIMNLRAP